MWNLRRSVLGMLVDLAVRCRNRPDPADLAARTSALDFDTRVDRWPLRMTGFLRDRLRRRWLRLRPPEP